MNEDKLYDAIARVILQETVDEWNNKLPSPLMKAINLWLQDKLAQEKLRDLVVKKLDMNHLAQSIAEKMTADFQNSSWTTLHETRREKLNDVVLSLVAAELAKEKLQELKSEDK